MAYSQSIEIPGPYKWKNRIVLVFSPEKSTNIEKQMAVFSNHQKGMQERDLLVFEIRNESIYHPNGDRDGKKAADRLRNKYRIAENEFSVILIGKDGTEKLRQSEVLNAEKLFTIIDGMPMRRQEIKNAKEH